MAYDPQKRRERYLRRRNHIIEQAKGYYREHREERIEYQHEKYRLETQSVELRLLRAEKARQRYHRNKSKAHGREEISEGQTP